MVEQPNVFDPLHVNWQPTTHGMSLFHSIPERNCSAAGIPGRLVCFEFVEYLSFLHLEQFCPCSRSTSVDITSDIIKQLAQFSIDHINNFKLKNYTHLCAVFELQSIIRAELELLSHSKQKPKNVTEVIFTHLYTVVFEVAPSNAIFESRLLYDQNSKMIKVHGDILRINLYGQSSSCINDTYELRSFCYCIVYHNKLKSIPSATSMMKRMDSTLPILRSGA